LFCLSCFGVFTRPQTEASRGQKKSCDEGGATQKGPHTEIDPLNQATGTVRHVATFPLRGAHPKVRRRRQWTGTASKEIGNKREARSKKKWGKLTDDDLTMINGQREQLEGIIQQRYGLAKDLVRDDVDAWLKSQP